MKRSFAKEKAEIKNLVTNFARNEDDYCRSGSKYNETQLRKDFVEPFFGILGWDVENMMGLPQNLREVAYEGKVDSDDESRKKPDYAFRLAGKRKFFVETKKPSIAVERDSKSAFQLRRYGWSAKLPVSVLTNFKYLIIYDCQTAPDKRDTFRTCRMELYSYHDYEQKFEEIYELLSRESVYSGAFDKAFAGVVIKGSLPIDEYFLTQIDKWRKRLANELIKKNPDIKEDELNFLVESFINRIVFLRICEDREIEKYETLLQTAKKGAKERLIDVFKSADKKYNSGLFDFRKDTLSLRVAISDNILVKIIKDLYYPRSPYIFSVVESNILGQIYELFLTKRIVIADKHGIKIVKKPEITHDLGIISTPQFIVEEIVDRTIRPLCEGKDPRQISELRFVDIACGSGSFLLEVYNYLLNYHLNLYVKTQAQDKIYRGEGDNWYLTIQEKKRILLNNIFGIDIDPSAVEVTKFSLLVRLLEDESASSVNAYASSNVLPSLEENIKCGNSLVDKSFFRFKRVSELSSDELDKLKIFDWDQAFQFKGQTGFDAILGNPPYTRIQVMKKLFPLELEYYQQHYQSGHTNNFDKYYLFIERALDRLRDNGLAGFIVPHKFMKIKAGETLRRIISEGAYLQELVHFGKEQVFEKSTTTYTCLLVLNKSGSAEFKLELVKNLHDWKYNVASRRPIAVKTSEITSAPWLLIVGPLKMLVERLQKLPKRLSDLADIFVGLQTSMDKVYVIKPKSMSNNKIRFRDFRGREWTIEKGITRPAIYDLETTSFMNLRPNSLIIFPYFFKNEKAFPYREEELRKRFPLALSYLRHYRRLLAKRDVSGFDGEKWFRYGRSQSLTKFDGRSKLIVKVLSLAPCFTYDNSNLCFTGGGNGPYYGVSLKSNQAISEFFLQGVLNSKLMDLFVKNWSSVFRAGYYSYGKEFIEKLPMPDLDLSKNNDKQLHGQIVGIVKRLRHLEKQLEKINVPAKRSLVISQMELLKDELDEAVYSLYNLRESEKEYLKNLDLS
jgi:type I restriction-modification system DNA methylase subunit